MLAVLDEVDENSNSESRIAEALYQHENIIVNQCVQRYTLASLKFDEPGTNAHFEFAPVDAYIFKVAVSKGEIVGNEEGSALPDQPAVYAGSVARKLDEAYLNQDDLADEETGEKPELDEAGQALLENPHSAVPKRPMFLAKSISDTWMPDASARLGKTELAVNPSTPYAYYYECPEGKQTTPPAPCDYTSPYGGIVDTISGKRCFQYLCDDNANMENTTTQYSGCGIVSDGFVSQPTDQSN
jgi:hypothetical protein